MKLVCLCLNVKIEVQTASNLEKPLFQLTTEEKGHPFFCQSVSKISPDKGHVRSAISGLVKSEVVGSWNVRQCSICKIYTHAANCTNGVLACSSSLVAENIDLRGNLNNRPSNYSRAFQLILPTNLKMPHPSSAQLEENKDIQPGAIKEIKSKAVTYIELAERKVENAITMYAARQRQTLEHLKHQVQYEEGVLLNLLTMAKDEDKSDSLRDTTNIEKLRSSLLNLDNKTSGRKESKENYNMVDTDTIFDADADPFGIAHSFNMSVLEEELRQMQVTFQSQSQKAPSSDALGIFEMDDISQLSMDQTLLESLDSDTEDLSYVERTPVASLSQEVARSAPITVPVWPLPASSHQNIDKKPADGQDIAASIQELAKSVRESSEDVFGELPRPILPRDA